MAGLGSEMRMRACPVCEAMKSWPTNFGLRVYGRRERAERVSGIAVRQERKLVPRGKSPLNELLGGAALTAVSVTLQTIGPIRS